MCAVASEERRIAKMPSSGILVYIFVRDVAAKPHISTLRARIYCISVEALSSKFSAKPIFVNLLA